MNKNNNKIIYNKSIVDLKKKYKKGINRLFSITKKEVEAIDDAIGTKNQKSVLGKSKWWYIEENETYYEIPRLFSIKWFKNLHVAIKTSICIVIAGGITCGTVLPIYLNKNKKQDKDYSSYSVACVGDSITWGLTSFIGTQMDEPYPVVLKKSIGFGHVSNYGIPTSTLCSDSTLMASGTETKAYAPMVERIKTIANTVNLIIIWGGINDIDRECNIGSEGSSDPENVYGALDNMCEYLNVNFSNSFVMFMTPLPVKYYGGSFYYAEEIVSAMKYTCNKYNYPLLDLTHKSEFEDEINSGKTDGVHPGQAWIKDKLVPKIVTFIKENL